MSGHRAYSDVHKPTAAQRREAAEHKRGRKHNKELDDLRQINWEHYDHATLYDMVMKAQPGKLAERARQWSELSKEIAGTTGQVQNILQGLLSTWRGPAAKSAGESNTRLTQWAGEAAHTTDRIGEGLSNFAEAVVGAQKHMPEPVFYYAERHFEAGYDVRVDRDPSDAVLLKNLTDDHQPNAAAHAEARAKAVQVMKTFATESHDVRAALPDYTATAPAPRPAGPDQVPTVTYTPMPEHKTWPPAQPPVPVPVPPKTTPEPEPPAPGNKNGTEVASYPTGVTNPPAGGTSTYGPSGPHGSYGAGQSGGGAFGPGFGARTGSEATPRGGALSGAGGIAGRAGGGFAEGAAGRAGASGGAGGMYPGMGGAGAPGEDDTEHKSRYIEGLDLFDDLPPAYPPVFGA
ncbi:uncharacterized protein YukE [Actinokineospora baliensis]|uniref:WXG100 family type VII secretion target n=1 Tax=Actinokineospora baliensis TaxID=547056 RepID=UPI00195CC858|nr:PPE domain-containing protein [Actinokineospora baliensis]MBM7770594.1 uncharacterized protein YukE [Actinokineospora baliensis]